MSTAVVPSAMDASAGQLHAFGLNTGGQLGSNATAGANTITTSRPGPPRGSYQFTATPSAHGRAGTPRTTSITTTA